MKKIIPPENLFAKRKILTIQEIKGKLSCNLDLCNFFLILIMNHPVTHAELTRELSRIFENSYNMKTTRYLERLSKLGLIDSLVYKNINFELPSDNEKKIIKKVEALKNTKNEFSEGSFLNRIYYYPTPLGQELIEFTAKKCGWKIEDE